MINNDTLRAIPLGGLGEIGRNMMVLECGDDCVAIDAGIMFPKEDMPGVDFAIPDFSYLRERQDRLRAVLITHGHEDHIGALPYLLSEMNVPVYAPRLACDLIAVKLRERRLLSESRLNPVMPGERIALGDAFSARFFRVCHSIPDAMGIALDTPLGVAVHTGDFKIDHTPVDGEPMDFGAITRLVGDDGAFLLFSDSTYAEVEGYTMSERAVGEALDRAIGEARGRVMVATFASLISRIQQVVNAAVKHGRKVAVVGRSMVNNVRMARTTGYLNAPDDTIIPMSKARNLPLEEVVIVATGSQGEPTSALVRISNGDHQDIVVVPGDTVIISASPIPGNETVVARTIDNLMRQGAKVLYSRVSLVHTRGHAAREELKMMLNVVKPRYFVPVHGEYRHLASHAALARDMGIPGSRVFTLEDGDVLELDGGGGEVVDRVRAGHVFIDGGRALEVGDAVLSRRMRLARDGAVSVSATVSARTGLPLSEPRVSFYGVSDLEDSETFSIKASKHASSALENLAAERLDLEQLRARLSRSVADFLYGETRRRPAVFAVIERV